MRKRGTSEDFADWVEPHLAVLARYAARYVATTARDEVVDEALIRARQRWSTYDESRGTAVAWLLGILADRCRGNRTRRLPTRVVELVDTRAVAPSTHDVDLERAIEGLGRRQRLAVDLRHFVGLDVAIVAEVMGGGPGNVATTLRQARARLCDLLGDGDTDLMEERLSAEARRWQEDQPVPPDVPLDRLDAPLARRPSRQAVVAAVAMAVLLGGGAVAVVRALGGADTAPRPAATSPTPLVGHHPSGHPVPWRDLEPRHPVLGHDTHGVRVTPYDHVSATGSISGTVQPGDTLVFDATLTAPGIITLHPCPDYTIAFGTQTTTRRLNCAQVPYFASIVRPDGRITAFRPVLPAGTAVFFRMQVTVPDEPGRQKVLWTLDGPQKMPGFYGIVQVVGPSAS
jgi:DNA-directed RNA polymerase specialized sigma24 family protein